MSNTEKLLISRSAILSYNACHRKGYLDYFYNGHGLAGHSMPQAPFIGICIHAGLEYLFQSCTENDIDPHIDHAVKAALEVYNEILSKRELGLKFDEDIVYSVRYELPNLIEALIRVYAMHRLPEFLAEYEVLEVEREEVVEDFTETVTWLGKADGLLLRKRDNALIALSIKTAGEFASSTMRNILHDMQGVSEVYAIEKRLNGYLALLERNGHLSREEALAMLLQNNVPMALAIYIVEHYVNTLMSTPIKVLASQYEFLIKGRKSLDSFGQYKYSSHLLHPIKSNDVVAPGVSGLVFGSNKSNYEWGVRKGRLPKNLEKINIWEDIGLEAWLAKLNNLEVQPELGHPFDNIIIAGPDRLVARREEEIEEWEVSTRFKAEQIEQQLDYIGINSPTRHEELHKILLMQYFDKNTASCHDYYGEDCLHVAHCHQGLDIEEGLQSGFYQIRRPHHKAEVDKFIEKGYLNKDEI